MFDSIKKLFTKTFVPQKEEKAVISILEKKEKPPLKEISPISSFEPSYIEPSPEPVIKRTQRALKYRR